MTTETHDNPIETARVALAAAVAAYDAKPLPDEPDSFDVSWSAIQLQRLVEALDRLIAARCADVAEVTGQTVEHDETLTPGFEGNTGYVIAQAGQAMEEERRPLRRPWTDEHRLTARDLLGPLYPSHWR